MLEKFTQMENEDGPETRGTKPRQNGAEQLSELHTDYENRVPKEEDAVEMVVAHNAAHPKLTQVLNSKKSTADAGVKFIEKRVCDPTRTHNTYYDPHCKACMKLKALRELQQSSTKPRCQEQRHHRPTSRARGIKKNVKLKKKRYRKPSYIMVMKIKDSGCEIGRHSQSSLSEVELNAQKRSEHRKRRNLERPSNGSMQFDMKKRKEGSMSSFNTYGSISQEPMVDE